MGQQETLLCAALPFGYGPAAKLIALARRLRREWRLVFAGRGPALELVRKAPGLFDEVVEAAWTEPRVVSRASRSFGILSIMDRQAGQAAQLAEVPLFVVDSLLWMRRAVPGELRGARRYWAQRFPGLSPARYEPRPTVVGPVLAPLASPTPGRHQGLVVHLGGCAAPDGRQRLYESYARFVVEAVVASGLPERFGSVTVMGGAGVVASLDGVARDGRVVCTTASPGEARAQMAAAEAVVTAPGLTATLECFCDGTPAWFLPPENYSQWCILKRLRTAGVAGDAMHWEDLEGVPRLLERLPESAYEPVVRETIRRLTRSPAAAGRLRAGLERVGTRSEGLGRAQEEFFASLGGDGAEAIASALFALREGNTVSLRDPRAAAPTLPEESPQCP